MSKKNRRKQAISAGQTVPVQSPFGYRRSSQPAGSVYLKTHWWIIAVIAFLSLGALGAGLKHLENTARQETAQRGADKVQPSNEKEQNFLARVNPFVSAPLPTATPALAKEYIYAGSRLLAVEDAAANAAPPADLAIWRPSTGYWWVMGGTNSQQFSAPWGAAGDKAVPGDYDGDGKTDLCVFRPSTNAWWIFKSSDNSYYAASFGGAGDIPAPADYDGDGKTDIAVFRPSTGTWYITESSTGNVIFPQFGLSADVPAPADYDGDGRADIAVWRTTSTTFYVARSSNGQWQSEVLGQTAGDVPVSGDYDGDGKADYAIKSGNNWIIKQSSNNQTQQITWQQAGDIPVQNDYDGDGKLDIAVWRDATGYWYIRKSTDGSTRTEQWGMSGDIPVPAFYRR